MGLDSLGPVLDQISGHQSARNDHHIVFLLQSEQLATASCHQCTPRTHHCLHRRLLGAEEPPHHSQCPPHLTRCSANLEVSKATHKKYPDRSIHSKSWHSREMERKESKQHEGGEQVIDLALSRTALELGAIFQLQMQEIGAVSAADHSELLRAQVLEASKAMRDVLTRVDGLPEELGEFALVIQLVWHLTEIFLLNSTPHTMLEMIDWLKVSRGRPCCDAVGCKDGFRASPFCAFLLLLCTCTDAGRAHVRHASTGRQSVEDHLQV
jgi:hypothetical protein